MFSLKPNQIQIWHLDLQAHNITKLGYLLSPAELERANSFGSSDRFAQFSSTRAALRILLAKYSSGDPQKVEIKSGINGKPFSPNCCYFNLSHSHNLALFAFSQDSEIGIDLEYMTARNFAGLAKRLISQSEQQAFLRLSPTAQLQFFYQYWTTKEAQIKLQAGGIFQSGFDSNCHFNFVPESGYMAAIAYDHSICSFEYRIFDPEIEF